MNRPKLRSLEGARGVAAFGVLAYHTGVPGAARLWLGVPLFFLLSGFLLFQPFARAIIDETRWPSLPRFARSRVLRIFPAYWAVLTFLVIDGAIGDGRRLASNYLLVQLPLRQRNIVGGSWTLCIEVAYYAALPGFAAAAGIAARRMRRREERAALLVLALVPAFPVSYAYLRSAGFSRDTLPIWLPGYLDEFAIGMLLAVAFAVRPKASARVARLSLVGSVVLGALASWRMFTFGAPDPYGNGGGIIYARLMEVAFALALFSVLAMAERTLLGRLLSSRLLVAAGTISYAVYLWNLVVITRLRGTALWLNDWAGLVESTVIVGTIALVSWVAIERPALARKEGLRRRTAPVEGAPVPDAAAA